MDKYVLQVEYRERENSDHSFSLPHCRSSRAIVCVDPTLHCEDKKDEGNAENGDGAAAQQATDGSKLRTGRLSRLTKRIYAMQESLKVHQKKKKKEKKKRRDKKRKKQQSGIRLGATSDINRNFLEVLKQYKPYAEQKAQEKQQLFPKMKPLLLSDPPKPQDSSLSSALFAPPSLVGIDTHDNAGDGLSLEGLPPATFFPNSRPNFSSTSSSSSMVSPSPSEAENFSIPFRSAPVTQPFYCHPYQAPCLLVPNNQDTPSPCTFFQAPPSSLSPLPHSTFHFSPFTPHIATNRLLLTPQHTTKNTSNENALESGKGQEGTDPMQTVPPLPQPIPQPREIAPPALGQVKLPQKITSTSPAPLSLAEQSPLESFGITLSTAATPRPRARGPSLVNPKSHVAPVTVSPAMHLQNNHSPSKAWKGPPRPFAEFEDARRMISATPIIDDASNYSEPLSQQDTLQQTIIHSKPPLPPYPIVTARQVLSQIDATSQVEKQGCLAPPVTKMEDEKNEQKKSRPGWEKWLRWNAKEQARMNAANKQQQQTIPTNA
ncbi:hypothetical protein QOT17_015506 [Balamuthia mandrillaris]